MGDRADLFDIRFRNEALCSGWSERLELDLPHSSDDGAAGRVYSLGRENGVPAPCCLKVFKLDARFGRDEDKRDFHDPKPWAPAINEYNKLLQLDGLEGSVPRALAYGLVRYGDDADTVHPGIMMEDLKCAGYVTFRSLVWGHRGGAWSAQDASRFGLELLKAIERLADEGVVHADLSPNNVMVRPGATASGEANGAGAEGETVDGARRACAVERVALVDFGHSRDRLQVVTPAATAKLGTPAFMAPEMVSLEACSDPRLALSHAKIYGLRNEYTADLWSLGALLFTAFTGASPKLGVSWDAEKGCYFDIQTLADLGVDEAHERMVEAKRHGLTVCDDCAHPQDAERALDNAIRVCTRWSPGDRAVDKIRRYLLVAAGMEDTTPDSGPDGSDTFVEPRTDLPALVPNPLPGPPEVGAPVYATAYRMFNGKLPYSPNHKVDLLVLQGCSQEARWLGCELAERMSRELTGFEVEGITYRVEPVDWSVGDFQSELLQDPTARSRWRDAAYVYIQDPIAPTSTSHWFDGFHRLRRVLGAGGADTDFERRLDTSHVADMSAMFRDCGQLVDAPLLMFDGSQVEDMSEMFAGCTSLESVDVSMSGTGMPRKLSRMFEGCTRLCKVTFTERTDCVEDMSYMFAGCTRLEEVEGYSVWFAHGKSAGMFQGCGRFDAPENGRHSLAARLVVGAIQLLGRQP